MNVESFYNPDLGNGLTSNPDLNIHTATNDARAEYEASNSRFALAEQRLYVACLERDTAIRRAQWMTVLSGFSRALGDPLHSPQKSYRTPGIRSPRSGENFACIVSSLVPRNFRSP